MTQHAMLSPSAAHRWMRCPASVRVEAGMEDKGSSYAEEGTLAHALCARHLKERMGLPTDDEEREIAGLYDQYHTAEMDDSVAQYTALVWERYIRAKNATADARLLIETRVDCAAYAPGCWGTADAIIIADDEMAVIDFKYGQGVEVSATGNPQMRIYALAAYELFSADYDLRRVRMTIVQPRKLNISEELLDVQALVRWGAQELRPRAARALTGAAEQQAGDWCRFCKARAVCRALADSCLGATKAGGDYRKMTPEELARLVLPQLDMVREWATAVKDWATAQAIDGTEFPGWKVVGGRKTRAIANPSELSARLQTMGYDEERLWKPREMLTLTALEKLVGRKVFAERCGDLLTTKEGPPALVPETDKRPRWSAAARDFEGVPE